MAKRQSLSVRVRFEVFKRDKFTCRYCGKRSPEAVLEIDHIIAVANGGSNDEINLITSCFECNRGKSDKNLSEVITGEDPYDRTIQLLERERQLKEYKNVQQKIEKRIENELSFFIGAYGITETMRSRFKNLLYIHSLYDIKRAWEIACAQADGDDYAIYKYCYGILRNWKNEY